jgi:hypothetical protein
MIDNELTNTYNIFFNLVFRCDLRYTALPLDRRPFNRDDAQGDYVQPVAVDDDTDIRGDYFSFVWLLLDILYLTPA